MMPIWPHAARVVRVDGTLGIYWGMINAIRSSGILIQTVTQSSVLRFSFNLTMYEGVRMLEQGSCHKIEEAAI